MVTSFKAAKNPVKQYSRAAGLPLHDWAACTPATAGRFDLGVVVSFGHLIPETFIDCFDR